LPTYRENKPRDFFGIETAFDSICLLKLVKAARAMSFSPLVLYIGLQCHMATRVFKIGNWASDLVHPNASIIAGCNLSDKFTKIILYNTLDLAHSKFDGVKVGQLFDDIAQTKSIKPKKSWWGFLQSVAFIAHSFSSLRLSFSKTKTFLVASTPSLTKHLVARLKKMGIGIQGAQVVRDLGVDYVAGIKRYSPTYQGRLEVVKTD